MYGFGGVAGSFGPNSSQSFGMDYVLGPVSIDAAYTYVKYPTLDNGGMGVRNWGLGGHYLFSTNGVLDVLYTQTTNVLTSGRVDVFEAGFTQPIANIMTVAFAYQYMIGNATLNKNHAHQFNLTLDHSLSKRTDVYLSAGYQHATGDEGAQILGVDEASSSPNQAIFRVGMRHFF
jgi:predicted porin